MDTSREGLSLSEGAGIYASISPSEARVKWLVIARCLTEQFVNELIV